MPAPLLRLTQLTKSFAGVQALAGISFELFPGEVHAVVGENGAGKSTLVKLITGAQWPDTGTIEIAGEPRTHLTPAKTHRLGISCIYQQPALFPELNVAENIGVRLAQFGAWSRVNWPKQRSQAIQLLERVGGEVSPDTLVRELSMPEQQLVEIACALGSEARIVIMDEPTASLTQREQQLLFKVVRKLREQGVGVLYVSHRLEEVFALADQVTVLRDGRKVCTSPTAELNKSTLIHLMVGREIPPEESRHGTAPGPVVLSVKNLGCSASAIQGINFDLHAGEILGIGGLVGAGRTELARTLFGLTPADQGEILLSNRAIRIDSPATAVRCGIAYVPEDRTQHGVIPELPVDQNISLASHKRVFPRGWLSSRNELRLAEKYIQNLGIVPPTPRAVTSALSGGNQQKVSLARWLATEPKILILDEPTQGVDVGAKYEIHKIIRSLAAQGMAVLLISSDLPELLSLSDRIAVMRGGRLVALLPGTSDAHQVMSAAFGHSTMTS